MNINTFQFINCMKLILIKVSYNKKSLGFFFFLERTAKTNRILTQVTRKHSYSTVYRRATLLFPESNENIMN